MQIKDLVLVGASGFGREVLWQLSQSSYCKNRYNIIGFVDDAPNLQGKEINGAPVLGDTLWLLGAKKSVCAVICVGNSISRKAIYDRLKSNLLIEFPTVFAEDVRYSEFVEFGQGCIICLSSILTTNITLGDFVVVNWDCTIGHDCKLDDFTTLYPSVNVSGNVCIGSCCEIGTGTNIIQGKTIGYNAIIGAGSVVVRDIPPNCTAVGVPAAPIKYR
ncbi:MAG: acetyltransferase [Oscillospiraceae bacterium]|nr:acetyltransferase [Oscillospiraceae bacterium]